MRVFARALPKATLVFLLSTVVFSVAEARLACELVFQNQTAETLKLVKEDSYKQWMLWEQTANFAPFVKTTEAFQIPVSKVSKDALKLDIATGTPKNFLEYIFQKDGTVWWFKHPHNTEYKVPFQNTENVTTLDGYYTASRSVALDGEFRGLTLKMGTDFPHGPKGQYQPKKAFTKDDVLSAMIHSKHLKEMDKELGEDRELIMLPETMTVADKASLNGYVVRDIRAMDSGHYYVPALSIPYIGREIAAHNHAEFNEFWKKNYAELLGRAKAKLLLRYGLQMETPNSQNMLIQLDRNLQPTGRIVFRDISDSFFVDVAGEGLGFQKQMKVDVEHEYDPVSVLQPYWSNSSWRFDEAGSKSVPYAALQEWGYAHNKAYQDYIEAELGVKMNVEVTTSDQLTRVYNFLASEEGQAALRNYRKKHTRKAS